MNNPQDCYACLIPKPTSILSTAGSFTVLPSTKIIIGTQDEEIFLIASLLSAYLEPARGDETTVANGDADQSAGNIQLRLNGDTSLGDEGYELSITTDSILLAANCPAGLFYGAQTLRQLLPLRVTEPLKLPAVLIRDTPRFEWRGAMLDVARHFFGVEDVKRYIDLIAHYKMNRLHLHLTDDQGWRIEIKSWPQLTEIGGKTQVGGGGGGYYTQDQYQEIVDYARGRYVTIVPETETPGHTNAALASYAELNISEEAPALFEGIQVGFSTLWINSEITYQFLNDVIRELAALTPTPYIHIGGDEAQSTPEEDYKKFIKRIQEIVISHGKRTIGWSEIGEAHILPSTIVQHWVGAAYQGAKQQGAKIILSPANKAYLDMKYDSSSPLGLDWAGLITVKDSYDWEPGSYMNGLEESDILGIEAPLWSETLLTMKDIEYMAFPRLPGLAELAWSPKGHNWEEYRQRLAAHGKRMEAMGINFYRSPDVDWEE
ncbi:MAG TPA: beta-N-acetylhexosaminidase [Anaerolineales bacterium]|nr:beta-N-acetylhexosaminidase [Anaerolineales bacterium]